MSVYDIQHGELLSYGINKTDKARPAAAGHF